jgi:hypothetical protein
VTATIKFFQKEIIYSVLLLLAVFLVDRLLGLATVVFVAAIAWFNFFINLDLRRAALLRWDFPCSASLSRELMADLTSALASSRLAEAMVLSALLTLVLV